MGTPFTRNMMERPFRDSKVTEEETERLENHLVIIGFGLNGRNLARVAKDAGIPYRIVEVNANTVQQERDKGEPIIYGDAVHEEVLRHLYVKKARVVAIAISDPVSTRRIVTNLKRFAPGVHVIVRTRYVKEVDELYRLGANEVIPEEFETSVEIFSRVLSHYLVPQNEIFKVIRQVRADTYGMLREPSPQSGIALKMDQYLDGMEVMALKASENSPWVGETLGELQLRGRYGVTLLAMELPDGEVLTQLSGATRIQKGARMIFLGGREELQYIQDQFQDT